MSVGWPIGTLTVTFLAVAAASALGATIRQPPTVSGDPSPGSELTATPGEWTPPGAIASSEPTAVVVKKPYSIPAGGDIGETCIAVTPTAPGEGTFTSGSPGAGSTPAPDTSLPFVDPFPVVRISGRFTRSLTRLTRVTISAPGNARVRVDCRDAAARTGGERSP